MELLIKNGTVVSPWKREQADILVDRGKIVSIGKFSEASADKVIDALGKIVIPGGIDSHTHIKMEVPFMGARGKETFYTASVAAAIGGTTTIIDFASVEPGQSALKAFEARKASALDDGIVTDFGLHVILKTTTDDQLAELKELVLRGCPSFKFYVTYDSFRLDDGQVMALMKAAKECDAILGVHAENNDMANYNKKKLIERGETGWRGHLLSKPVLVEEEAIRRIAFFAQHVGVPLVIFHITTKAGVEICKAAQEKGIPLYSETCIHYLTFNDSVYDREDGYLYLISPPIKEQYNSDALWEGIRNRSVSSCTTDHAPWTHEEKLMHLKRDENGNVIPEFYLVPNGGPGIELRLPILINGVSEGKISWEQLVVANSYGAAKMFGLYPQKGLIEAGADADIVLVDPEKIVRVTNDMLHMNVDFTLYEGMEIKGWPVMSILRGKVITEGGKYVGENGYGRYLMRKLEKEVFESSSWLKR